MMALRPTIAKVKGRKAPTRHIDPLQLLPQRGVCDIDWPTGYSRSTDTISLLQLLPEISPGPRLLHMADGGGSDAVRRYEGSPERQAAGNGGILTPFVLPSGMDSTLSQLPPQEIILPFDEVLGMTMIVFILAESELAWRFLRSIITRQSALYNRGRGLILLDNNRSFPRQSASSSKEIRKGGPGRPTTLSRVQLFVVAFASSWDVLEYVRYVWT